MSKRTPENAAVLTAMWQAGEDLASIGDAIGMVASTVYAYRLALGLPERKGRLPKNHWSADQIADLQRRYANGQSMSEIAACYPGRTRSAVIGALHRNGKPGRAEPVLKAPVVKRVAASPRGAAKAPKPAAQSPFGALHPEEARAKRAAQQMAGLATIQAAVEGVGQNTVSLIERRFTQCAWPVGPDGQHLCCGDRVVATFRATPTYCERHSRMAVSKAQSARKLSVEPSPIRRAA